MQQGRTLFFRAVVRDFLYGNHVLQHESRKKSENCLAVLSQRRRFAFTAGHSA